MAVIHACTPCRMANQIAIFVPIPRGLIADVLINMLQVHPAREHFYLTYRFLIGKGWCKSMLMGSELGDAKFFVARYDRVQRISHAATAAEFCN